MLPDALDASYANNTSSVLSLLEQEDFGIKTALISPWLNPWSKVILEVLIVSQLRTTMHPFYRTLSLPCFCSYPEPDKSISHSSRFLSDAF
jgi:hypothetical protein